jgi:hypothetical protein
MFTPWKKLSGLLMMLYLVGLFATIASAQVKPPKEPKTKTPAPFPVPGSTTPGFFHTGDETMEASKAVDPAVTVKLCVSQGDLKINGWNRNEVRVFVKEGRKFTMKPLEKSPESGKINWLWVVNAGAGEPGTNSDCLAGERIEIDAPQGASFELAGRAARTSVDSVKKVKVKILEGVISLRNIPGGISAYTGQGDVLVENSGGSITLESTTGNIIAVEVNAGQIGETLRAKTNSGAISFQKVLHRQIEATSISGSLNFEGKFLAGGIYTFRTSNGAIQLGIPPGSSCSIKAIYGLGAFRSDFPLDIITQDKTPRAQSIFAKIGAGSASVSLTTSTGSISIRRTGAAAIP